MGLTEFCSPMLASKFAAGKDRGGNAATADAATGGPDGPAKRASHPRR
jgi:hypothetical protein